MNTSAPFFDRLCQLAERWLPEIEPWLRQARLFVFEHKSWEFVRTTMTAQEIELLNESFFLPFPVVAVEDPASVVVLADLEPEAAGVGARRGYVELVDQRGEGFREDRDGQRAAEQVFAAGTLVHIGSISMTAKAGEVSMVDAAGHHTGFDVRGGVHKACWFAGQAGEPEVLTEQDIPHEQMIGFLRNPATASEELWATNLPSRFVVESAPKKARDPSRARKIPRSHDRPVYTLLTPAAIRERYIPRANAPTGRKVGAHERRRHYRTLRSDRFTRMRGRTILVPATWVGPSEAVVGNRRYRVMVDL